MTGPGTGKSPGHVPGHFLRPVVSRSCPGHLPVPVKYRPGPVQCVRNGRITVLFGAYFGYCYSYWVGLDSIFLTRWCSSVSRAFGLHTKSMGSIPGEMKKKNLEYFWAALS